LREVNSAMNRRRLLLILLLLLLLTGLLLLPQVRWPVYGWLRGEAFYQGMPASWWEGKIYQLNGQLSSMDRVLERWTGNAPTSESVGAVFLVLDYVQYPVPVAVPFDLASRDSAVLPVLIELLRSDDVFIRLAAVSLLADLLIVRI
jgi:hypothetical protein